MSRLSTWLYSAYKLGVVSAQVASAVMDTISVVVSSQCGQKSASLFCISRVDTRSATQGLHLFLIRVFMFAAH
jgi:hypothetical protein